MLSFLLAFSLQLFILKQALDLEVFSVDEAKVVEEGDSGGLKDVCNKSDVQAGWLLDHAHHVVCQATLVLYGFVGLWVHSIGLWILLFVLYNLFENLEQCAGREDLRNDLRDPFRFEVLLLQIVLDQAVHASFALITLQQLGDDLLTVNIEM